MALEQDLYEPKYFKKRRLWKKALEERGIEIDCNLDDFILRMDFLLYCKQHALAYDRFIEAWQSDKTPTLEELKQIAMEITKDD